MTERGMDKEKKREEKGYIEGKRQRKEMTEREGRRKKKG